MKSSRLEAMQSSCLAADIMERRVKMTELNILDLRNNVRGEVAVWKGCRKLSFYILMVQ
jgi:hypothetical protein